MLLIARLWTLLDQSAVIELSKLRDGTEGHEEEGFTRRRWVGPAAASGCSADEEWIDLLGRELSDMARLFLEERS